MQRLHRHGRTPRFLMTAKAYRKAQQQGANVAIDQGSPTAIDLE
jgi:hypothetical protein